MTTQATPTTKRSAFIANRIAELLPKGYTVRAAERRAVKDWTAQTPQHLLAVARRAELASVATRHYMLTDDFLTGAVVSRM